MDSIDFKHRTRLVFEAGGLSRLGQLSRELGASRVLVVSDPGVVAAGHFQRGLDALTAQHIEVHSFQGVHENPSTEDVAACLQVAKEFTPDLLIGLGGGSSMDCAKGMNFLYSCGGQMEDYWGVGKATSEMLPMIAVPTTAGTGSEAQSFALISQAETHVKMACGDPRAACSVALLDPELTLTQPARVTALTGIDAVSHALESYVTQRRNPLSVGYSRQAWQLLSSGLPDVLSKPQDIEARGKVQLGAFFAGLAIETSMLGAAHALANPLTARFGITHGQAVGMMLPQVIRFNGEVVGAWYEELWRDVAHTPLARNCKSSSGSESLARFVHSLVALAGLETELSRVGVDEMAIEQLSEDATRQWTGTFNPRPLNQADFQELYRRTFAFREAC
ncbi:iron-containing alcohol dehydrogenase [Aureliella helgolandensis]|uniref:Alcohol dehydrogenase 2 n=1 Tax=Aureliella helgolandensis TaxID=2527968 RepID=A0A518G8Q2_9BACT|nr:iron-containing alcohol dehydrogenase [Aureliella helgolandensis]QDV24965.1 Alcohol dehydrogenase 2 [Aureliella helgolandensis]